MAPYYYFLTEGVADIVVLLADDAEAAVEDFAGVASESLELDGVKEADGFLSVCLRAWPNSTFLHRDAKLREQMDSPTLYTAGEMFTNISTFELPPKESYIS
jgi:hypothetical protein